MITLHVNTERGWRGAEQHAVWLAQALERRAVRGWIAARPGSILAERASTASLRVIDCNPGGDLAPLAAWQLRRAIRQHGVDVVHAHTARALAVAAVAITGTKARLVVSRHVEYPLKNNFFTRWKYARTSAILAVSTAARDALAAGGVAPERIELVPGGTDLSRPIQPASRAALAELGVRADGPLVVMVSALAPEKEPLVFVRALHAATERVPNLQGLLVGEGSERAAVEREIEALGLADRVHLAGFRSDADALSAAADLVVLSSRAEGGQPIALLQAMSCGKPVAATAAGGVNDLIVPGQSGLLAPVGDSAGLGAAIATILTDRVLSARLGQAALERVQRFSIDITAARVLEVYRRLLGMAASTSEAHAPRQAHAA